MATTPSAHLTEGTFFMANLKKPQPKRQGSLGLDKVTPFTIKKTYSDDSAEKIIVSGRHGSPM